MIHHMNLNNEPFQLIKNKIKTIEIRLYDEKRKKLKVGDKINFENRETQEHLSTEIINLSIYKDFKTLYSKYSKESLGYLPNEEADPNDMEKYYSKEEQQKYGVVAIEIKVLEN